MLGSSVVALALTPIWSAITKAIAEQDYLWINSIYKKMKFIAIVGTIAEFLVIPFAQIVVDIWLKEESIPMEYLYSLAFASLGSLLLFNQVFSSITNGFGRLKIQLLCFSIGSILKIPLAWILVNAMDSWIGVVWANVILLALYCIVEPLAINKVLKGRTISP